MAKETFWFKHDLNARGDKELIKVRMKMGMSGIGLYWCIIEMLYEEGGYLLRSEYERIAYELQSNKKDITLLVESYALFKWDEERFWSDSALVRINARAAKSQKAADSVNRRWGNTNVSKPYYETIPIRREEIRKEERGVSFSEDKTKVMFQDGSSQELGHSQLNRIKEGGYQPHFVRKGSIE